MCSANAGIQRNCKNATLGGGNPRQVLLNVGNPSFYIQIIPLFDQFVLVGIEKHPVALFLVHEV